MVLFLFEIGFYLYSINVLDAILERKKINQLMLLNIVRLFENIHVWLKYNT